jgi:carbon monoxide dehydrogenase subunit G
MKITNEFTVPIPVDQAWKVLTDLEGIAPCMPGAQLTGVDGEVYQGRVKVKVGPVISDFAGTAQFTSKDDTTHHAVIDAKGRDARSAGNASATVSASLTPAGDNATKVSVDTDLKISGKLAQFGSGMIKEVSSKLLAQFVANLEAKLAADTATPTPAASAPGADAIVAAPPAGSPPAASPGAAPVSSASPAAAERVSAVPEVAVATAPEAAVALGAVAPVGPKTDDGAAPAIAPDPAAGEIESAAGRLETASGTPEPVAPLRTPGADLSAASPPSSAASPAADPVSAVSDAAVATAPEAAVALGAVAPVGPKTDDGAAPAIVPDPSAGEVEPAAGRLETAPGTPEPVAPLRTPGADLSAASPASSAATSAVSPAATPTDSLAAAPAASSAATPATSSAAAASTSERALHTAEPEAIDLLAVAGGSIYKRVIPVAVGAVVVAAVIVWFVARG